jgi:predicted O-linked N-acetylglucosamine transferase (SPINDLY family)
MPAMTQVPIEQALHIAIAHHQAGRLAEAESICRQILSVRPDHAEAVYLLGVLASQTGRLDQAIACYEQALAVNPNLAAAHNRLGLAWYDKGQLDRAIAAQQRALTLDPTFADAQYDLGTAWLSMGQTDRAIACFQTAIGLKPDLADGHFGLGMAFSISGQLDQAIACYERALALKPDWAEAHCNLGNAWHAIGKPDKALANCQRAIALAPRNVIIHDNFLTILNYQEGVDRQSLCREARRWSSQHAQSVAQRIATVSAGSGQRHSNQRDPDRRLRIGYLSADFRDHASAFFLLPLLTHHDRRQVEAICYAEVRHPDKVTRRLQGQAGGWRSTVGLTDSQVAALVRQDRIDILVDLKLHTLGNRLLVCAQKPAPVQATWLGYPGTTGLDAIDYRLSDPYLDPSETDDAWYVERTVRLPNTFWCYDPLTSEPAVNALPGSGCRFITFGCLNNFCKVNDTAISLWAKVLDGVTGSRLLLLTPEGSSRHGVLDRFDKAGIAPDRIEFVPKQPRQAYLRTYHRIDIALDTFPCNGHTTSLDSFWMGVPVITLAGQTAVGRAGASQLSNLGLPELIARTPEQYVQIAAGLANDLPRLAKLRSTLRDRMRNSPLMDAPRFARDIEAAYRTMWRTWCAT